MKFSELIELIGDEPVFETSILLAGQVNPGAIQVQLSRWVYSGKILQLRRGLYCLATPYQKNKPHPFVIANRLIRASYVSTASALAYYALIPEHVPVTTSVTTKRSTRLRTPFGDFIFQHIRSSFFIDYRRIDLGGGQFAFISTPEKALLDHLHLQPGSDSTRYLQELRLQNADQLNLVEFQQLAENSGSPKLLRAASRLSELIESEEYTIL